ncbi:MAG: chlorite dismutase family protein [Microthrixaceae bacterium]|nr:chlorite dismutase family protein [Microthrixaceae bacterium]
MPLTEISEYASGVPEEMRNARLYPQLPPEGKPAFCFYPMSKKREGSDNWFIEDFDRRKEMMYEHRGVRSQVHRPGASGDHRVHRTG